MQKTKAHPVNDRMKSIIMYYDGSLTEFGKKCGMSRESVSQYIRSDSISKNMLNAFRVVYPSVNMDWVTTGRGNPFAVDAPQQDDCKEMVETMIKANKYQAEMIERLWKRAHGENDQPPLFDDDGN